MVNITVVFIGRMRLLVNIEQQKGNIKKYALNKHVHLLTRLYSIT